MFSIVSKNILYIKENKFCAICKGIEANLWYQHDNGFTIHWVKKRK